MKDIDKRLTFIINEMNSVISNLSRMVVDSMLHMSNQDCEIEDLKLQLDAADQDYQEVVAERNTLLETREALTKEVEYYKIAVNSLNDRFIELRNIFRDNAVVIGEGDLNVIFDSTIESDKLSRFLELLNMTEDDLYD